MEFQTNIANCQEHSSSKSLFCFTCLQGQIEKVQQNDYFLCMICFNSGQHEKHKVKNFQESFVYLKEMISQQESEIYDRRQSIQALQTSFQANLNNIEKYLKFKKSQNKDQIIPDNIKTYLEPFILKLINIQNSINSLEKQQYPQSYQAPNDLVILIQRFQAISELFSVIIYLPNEQEQIKTFFPLSSQLKPEQTPKILQLNIDNILQNVQQEKDYPKQLQAHQMEKYKIESQSNDQLKKLKLQYERNIKVKNQELNSLQAQLEQVKKQYQDSQQTLEQEKINEQNQENLLNELQNKLSVLEESQKYQQEFGQQEDDIKQFSNLEVKSYMFTT